MKPYVCGETTERMVIKGEIAVCRAVVMFEGGQAPTAELQATITRLRHAVTLDSLEKYLSVGVDAVVLATNAEELAHSARQLGAQVWKTGGTERFHLGQTLQRIVREWGIREVLYCSGAALPLISPEEIRWILQALHEQAPCVVVNNPQSIDLAAWSPADHVQRILAPQTDNNLGYLLQETGLKRILIPHSAGIHFDLDTPTDYLMLALSGRGGPRISAAMRSITWPVERLRRAADVLLTDLPEVALLGRVGTPIVEHFNRHLRTRLRVFSEERGMKALRREEEGLVVSMMAEMIEEMGPTRFFEHLASICSAVFFDTRVLFAHRGRRVTEWDRYHSDIGAVTQIQDPWVRTFTEAALACSIPVVLGGHAAVAGGLWLLVDRAIVACCPGTC